MEQQQKSSPIFGRVSVLFGHCRMRPEGPWSPDLPSPASPISQPPLPSLLLFPPTFPFVTLFSQDTWRISSLLHG